MTSQHAVWAKQHDWFIRRYKMIEGGYVVEVRDSLHPDGYQAFTDLAALRAWAGY